MIVTLPIPLPSSAQISSERSWYDGHAEIVKHALLEHLIRLTPTQSLLLQDLIH